MNRDEAMDWIDNASKRELQNPPSEIKEKISTDQECMSYYQVSLKFKQIKQEVDLWNKFRRNHAAREKQVSKGFFTTKWLLRLSTAGAVAAIALVLILYPFRWKQKSDIYTKDIVYSDPLELTLEIVSDFGIYGQYDMDALDYYYAITTF